MEGLNTDKVNINVGGGEGGGGGLGAAAMIAALGNRNQGNDTAAVLAALGNRNQGDNTAALIAALTGHDRRGYDGDGLGFGGGGGILGLLAILGLLRGRGGLGGGGDDCCDDGGHGRTAILQTLMEGQSDLRAQVPTTALQTQAEIQAALASLALGVQQGFANNKDATQAAAAVIGAAVGNLKDVTQAGFALTNNNILEGLCAVKETTRNDGDKTRALLVARFQQEDATTIAEQNAKIVALETRGHHDRHHAEQTLQITNTNTAVAQQQQQQRQSIDDARFDRLERAILSFHNNFNQTMLARTAQDIVNLGTMTASGTQVPTNVNQRN